MTLPAFVQRKTLTPVGRQEATTRFLRGASVSDLTSMYGVSRREAEQTIREALSYMSEKVAEALRSKETA